MNLVVALLMVLGLAVFLYSLVKPSLPQKQVVQPRKNRSCNEVDYLFQRNFRGGILDTQERRNQLYARLDKLIPTFRELNQDIEDIYEKLNETERDAKELVPENFEELEYQYGQKLITVPFEDQHRPGNGIPNFERPTFWDTRGSTGEPSFPRSTKNQERIQEDPAFLRQNEGSQNAVIT